MTSTDNFLIVYLIVDQAANLHLNRLTDFWMKF